MADYDYDLIVIGAGSGGVRAARIAAGQHGAKVAVVEEDRPGGTCVLRGCVPKKLLVYASQFACDTADAVGFGWEEITPAHDWPRLIVRKNAELDRLAGIYMRLLEDAGVAVIAGRGMLRDAHTVAVGDDTLTAEYILVATGGWPHLPDIEGLAAHGISSNEALNLPQLPREVVVFGAGYIAVEFAGIFNGLGAKTHLVYRRDLPLRGFDEDMRAGLAEAMAARGIILHPGCSIEKVTGKDDEKAIALSNGDTITADCLMVATGRKPKTDGLGLESAGIEVDKAGAIPVDATGKTASSSIYAIGDVTNRINLTPVAIAEGHAFADSVFGNTPRMISHENVASAVFSQPPIASVGLTETAAREAGRDVAVFTSRFNAMKNTISGREEKTVMKLIADKADGGRVIGVHMLGPDAPEIIQAIAVAMKAGATKADFDATIGIHPTAAEEFVTMK